MSLCNHQTSGLASFCLAKVQPEPEWVRLCSPQTEKTTRMHWHGMWVILYQFGVLAFPGPLCKIFLTVLRISNCCNYEFETTYNHITAGGVTFKRSTEFVNSRFKSWQLVPHSPPKLMLVAFFLCFYQCLKTRWIRESWWSNFKAASSCWQEGSPALVIVLQGHQERRGTCCARRMVAPASSALAISRLNKTGLGFVLTVPALF